MSRHRLDSPATARPAYRGGRRRGRRAPRTALVLGLASLMTATLIGVPIAFLVDLDTAGEGSAPTATRSPQTASAEAPSVGAPRTPPTSPAPRSVASPDPIPESGPGTFRIAPATPGEIGNATTYRVEVEDGLPFGPSEVATFVEDTLSDKRGWSSTGEHRLVRVQRQANLRIILASPKSADKLCSPLETKGRLSCRNGPHVVINAWRWRHGAEGYDDAITAYRRYVVNHETGHALGYPHVDCPGADQPAPVMLQQTIGLDGCQPNPWPLGVDLPPAAH